MTLFEQYQAILFTYA